MFAAFFLIVVSWLCRMYPVVPINARRMSEKDVIIGGYFFPKKVKLFSVVSRGNIMYYLLLIMPHEDSNV